MKNNLIIPCICICFLGSISITSAQGTIQEKPAANIQIKGKKNPLFAIDGIKQNKDYFKINDIDPENIESITVLRNEDAIGLYGLEAVDGAVLVTTKSGKNNPEAVDLQKKLDQLSARNVSSKFSDLKFVPKTTGKTDSISIRHKIGIGLREMNNNLAIQGSGAFLKEVLYIIDGKEIDPADVKYVDMDTIQTISVLKDQTSLAMYGEKGRNGVLIITTKPDKSEIKPAKKQ